MISSLKKIFQQNKIEKQSNISELQLLSGLMIEAANVDGSIDQIEIDKISKVLVEIFKEDPNDVKIELAKNIKEINNPKSLHYYTSKINKSFEDEKKFVLVQTLWEIILEDGKIHDFESNLIRRLAGLLYISDRQCGIAKKKALEKLENS